MPAKFMRMKKPKRESDARRRSTECYLEFFRICSRNSVLDLVSLSLSIRSSMPALVSRACSTERSFQTMDASFSSMRASHGREGGIHGLEAALRAARPGDQRRHRTPDRQAQRDQVQYRIPGADAEELQVALC